MHDLGMSKSSSASLHSQVIASASPHLGLAYRALVFARDNGSAPLYFVAGVVGGPWSAINALATSHKAHGGTCFYCKQGIKKGQATIDHVEPVALGGKSTVQNLVIACKPCNAKKGHEVIDLYNPDAGKEWLQALLTQVQQRLDALNPPLSSSSTSPDATANS
jgi:5-methylcytosine-specific restriction endonuclease McrA